MTPFRIVLIFIVLSLFGITLLPLLSVDLQPDYNAPKIRISYSLSPASPEIVEQEATAPLENILSQISDIRKIESRSNYNNGSITITFDKNSDIDFKRFEVSALIRQTYPKLHNGVSYPVISQGGNNQQNVPILVYTINGPFSPFEIKHQLQQSVQSFLQQIKGVSEVVISGAEDIQVTISVERERLKRYGVSKPDIISAIKEKSKQKNLGLITTSSDQQFFIKAVAGIESVSDLESLIVKSIENEDSNYIKSISLREIADIYQESQEPSRHFRINGLNAVRLSIIPEDGVNKLVLAGQIKGMLYSKGKNLPKGYNLYLDHDDTEYIQEELSKIYYRTGLSVAILLLFILVVHRSWKYLLILFTGILVNLCITAGLVYFLDIKIHLYTLAGITVSFGLIMDNAIVMLSHLHRRKNRRIFMPLLAASLTTIAALMVIFLLPEEDKRNLTEFSAIISVNLFVSLAVAIGYTPVVYELIYGRKQALSATIDSFGDNMK